VRRFDRPTRFGLAGLRHGAEPLAIGGVDHFDRHAGIGAYPFAVDEVRLAPEVI
jgi:hypothetical protein